jgi:hypothetical protein
VVWEHETQRSGAGAYDRPVAANVRHVGGFHGRHLGAWPREEFQYGHSIPRDDASLAIDTQHIGKGFLPIFPSVVPLIIVGPPLHSEGNARPMPANTTPYNH